MSPNNLLELKEKLDLTYTKKTNSITVFDAKRKIHMLKKDESAESQKLPMQLMAETRLDGFQQVERKRSSRENTTTSGLGISAKKAKDDERENGSSS
ncbi:hypothetical protein RIF29_28459 [Crotalaria pallida]|uniref:Uncharacterized protein n=1 Tax=Crotalaria pallida TaxID=3830 RepID=A0AAN9ECR7_CROPI